MFLHAGWFFVVYVLSYASLLFRVRKANQKPKPKERKTPGQTANSTRKLMPIVESEQKVLNLWFKDRQAQAVGPNAGAIHSSFHMVCESGQIPPERMRGGPGTVAMISFVVNHPRHQLVPLEIHH